MSSVGWPWQYGARSIRRGHAEPSSAPGLSSNATVVSRTHSHLTITHAGGIVSVKLSELEPHLQHKFGYRPPKPGAITTEDLDKAFSKANAKPRQIREGLSPLIDKLGPYAAAAILGLIGVGYLYFAACAFWICRRLKTPGAYKAWFPVLQWEPLFKAAGMSHPPSSGSCLPFSSPSSSSFSTTSPWPPARLSTPSVAA